MEMEVLIVGAGPSGLMAASTLSRYGINYQIIDQRPDQAQFGNANSLQPRTLEVFDSLDLLPVLEVRGSKLHEFAFWARDPSGKLFRQNCDLAVITPTCYPWMMNVDRGDVVQVLEQDLKARGQRVRRSMELLGIHRGSLSNKTHVVLVRDRSSHVIETWHTSYILGCDGSDSTVRRLTGLDIQSPNTQIMVEADLVAQTDFPDAHRRCTVRSGQRFCFINPGRGSKFRIRTILASSDLAHPNWDPLQTATGAFKKTHNASFMAIMQSLQTRIDSALLPYSFRIQHVSWIDRYVMRKGLASSLHDQSLGIFILGSAAHTHSHLTNHNMNSGMMDAFNLTWKLALVIQGSLQQSILGTYGLERHGIAEKFLVNDNQLDQMFAIDHDEAATPLGPASYEDVMAFSSGLGVRYPESALTRGTMPAHIREATNMLTPGKRVYPLQLMRHMDGNRMNLLDVLKPDGRFRLLIFAGELLNSAVFSSLAAYLASMDSPLRPHGVDKSVAEVSLLEYVLIHSLSHTYIMLEGLPTPFSAYPATVFEDVEGRGHASVGISAKLGALALVRPDGHVAMVTNMDGGSAITNYFDDLLKRSPQLDEFVETNGTRTRTPSIGRQGNSQAPKATMKTLGKRKQTEA